MSVNLNFEILTIDDIAKMLPLTSELNPHIPMDTLKKRHEEMFDFDNYVSFGCYLDGNLVGVSSGWLTMRLYSGKQLEVDNVVVSSKVRSQGIGEAFFGYLQSWAKKHDCNSIELNAFVQNGKSHKFYFNLGYEILGYHFQKKV